MKKTMKSQIWPPHAAFYIHSMRFITLSAEKSIRQIKAIMHVVQENSPEDPMAALPVHTMLDELQNVLIQAAGLSRYFWPVRKGHEWRGDQLRVAFDIADDSPLRSRDLRNSIEHFDERLDVFLEGDVTGHILPEYVGPFAEATEVPVRLFRAYYCEAYLRYVLERIADHPINMIHELLPWKVAGQLPSLQAAA